MADQTLTVKIVGEEKDLLRAFRSSTQATQRFSASFGTFVKGALVFEGVRASVQGISSAIRTGISEWSEQQKVAAQTAAAIRATGGIANVAAKDIERLGTRIQNLSGIDDEAIKSGANLILTFKQVRNELGRNNNVFDRATQAAVDLSVAGFGSIETTSKQLGKALNDPIRGMTALGRAGVTFTTKQREQIKALVESNRMLDAQKLILKEVESQVGGSAKALGDTLPGQLNKLREAFRNAFGDLVGVVAEPLANAAGAFSEFIPRIQDSVARLSEIVGPAIQGFVEAFTSRLPQIQRIAGSVLEPLREHVLPVLTEVAAIVGRFWSNMVETFSNRSGQLRQILANLGQILANVWTVARPTIVFLFEKAIPAALNVTIPLMEKVTGVVKVMSEVFVRAVSLIVKSLDTFLGGLTSVADAASHLPVVGDSFAGVADKVNASRESLRSFSAELDKIDGRKVNVDVVMNVAGAPASRAREGTVPQAGGKQAEQEAAAASKLIDQQRTAADQIATKSVAAESSTKTALTAAEKQRKVFDALMAALGLRRDRADATAGLKDDIAAADTAKRALQDQLKIQKGNVDLQRQLLQVNQDLAALRAQQRKGGQFEALGLTREGQERVAGIGAIRQRGRNLIDQLKASGLDPAKIRDAVRRISVVFTKQFDEAGRDVRQAILGMFGEIAGAFDQGTRQGGPLTKTSGLDTTKFLAELGLPVDIERELRGRLSGLNTSGQMLGGRRPQLAQTAVAGFGGGLGGALIVESHVTVELNGEKVGSVVTHSQERARRRNPKQKRGPNRSRGL